MIKMRSKESKRINIPIKLNTKYKFEIKEYITNNMTIL